MHSDDHMKSGHVLDFPLNQSTPLLLITAIAILIIIVQNILPIEWMQYWGFELAKEEINVDEGVPNFFLALKHT